MSFTAIIGIIIPALPIIVDWKATLTHSLTPRSPEDRGNFLNKLIMYRFHAIPPIVHHDQARSFTTRSLVWLGNYLKNYPNPNLILSFSPWDVQDKTKSKSIDITTDEARMIAKVVSRWLFK